VDEKLDADMKTVAIVPCRDEQQSVVTVTEQLLAIGVDRVVICIDPGTTDDTESRAHSAGATVVHAPTSGYDGPVLAGIALLRNEGYQDRVLFLDGGDKYDITSIGALLSNATIADVTFGIRNDDLYWHQRLGNLGFACLLFLRYRHWVKDVSSVRLMSMATIERVKYEDRQFSLPFQTVVHALHCKMSISYVPIRCRKRTGVSKVSGSRKNSAKAAKQMGLALLKKPDGLR
jgi:glycosyltransferase involved in cell wall biosynthesis